MNSMNDALPSYVVTPPAVTSLPVRGTKARFPIRRVYCVGRNYAAHAIEMGRDPNKEPPFFFQKNPDNVILAGETFPVSAADQRPAFRDRAHRRARQGRREHHDRERRWSMSTATPSAST